MAKGYWVRSDPDDKRLTVALQGRDHNETTVEVPIIRERPLTLSLNSQKIVTLNTIGDHPDLLAIGYLLNQDFLKPDDTITAIEFEEGNEAIVVRSARASEHDENLKREANASKAVQGTVYTDLIEDLGKAALDTQAIVRASWLYALQQEISTTPSLYQKAGALHGCVLCRKDQPADLHGGDGPPQCHR